MKHDENYVSDVKGLITSMRLVMTRVDAAVGLGQFSKSFEVGPKSLVQIVQCTESPEDHEPLSWSYIQCYVSALEKEDQDLILGAFLNETVRDSIKANKVIGIYEPIKQGEV